MALGTVEVNNLNLGQGSIPEIERHFLFVGSITEPTKKIEKPKKTINGINRIDSRTDIPLLIGDGVFARNVAAAQANAGQNWSAVIYALKSGETWETAVDIANETDSFEAVVIVDAISDKAQFTNMQEKAAGLVNKLGRWVFFLAATPGITDLQTWSDYETAMIEMVSDVAAPMVVLVPQLHGTNIGALAGRLCDRSVTIADTPMRVATGSVLGLGKKPKDSTEKELPLSTLQSLSNARFSVPQWYSDYEGVYWGDASTLAAKGSDYQFLEYVRPVHKLNRRVRIKAIRRIGDKQLNSTPESIAQNKQYFSSDMRQMSKSIAIGPVVFPGEIMPPNDDDVSIQWPTKTKVNIGLIVKPHNCPKGITVNIALDSSNEITS